MAGPQPGERDPLIGADARGSHGDVNGCHLTNNTRARGPSGGSDNFTDNSSFGGMTLRVDLRRVAHKLSVPLSALLYHFQTDPSSECITKNRFEEPDHTFRVEIAVDRETTSHIYQDPIEGTPLPSPLPSPKPSMEGLPSATAAAGGKQRDSSELGTAVVVSHHTQQGPSNVRDSARRPSLPASRKAVHSHNGDARASVSGVGSEDGSVKVLDIVHASREEVTKPYIGYIVRDGTRGATMMALPNLPPSYPGRDSPLNALAWNASTSSLRRGDTEVPEPPPRASGVRSCLWNCLDACAAAHDERHESTSHIGDVNCCDFSSCFSGTPTVIRSVVLYSHGSALMLQVQRKIPAWGVPTLLLAMGLGTFVPLLYLKLSDWSDEHNFAVTDNSTVGIVAATVWWSFSELIFVTLMMVVAALTAGARYFQPLVDIVNRPSAAANSLLLLLILSDCTRRIGWSFLQIREANGPAYVLNITFSLWVLIYKLMFSRSGVASSAAKSAGIIETVSTVLVLAGGVLQGTTLDGFSDWGLNDGVIAGAVSGISTASYIISASLVIPNQPILGVMWLCKIVSFIGTLVVVNVRTHNESFWSHWTSDFMGGDSARIIVLLAVAGAFRDLFYLCALSAMHCATVASAMVTQYVFTLLLSHAILPSHLELGNLNLKLSIPAVCLTCIGLCVSVNVVMREIQYSEVDLTSPELTRKAARPPPRLTMAALRQQQRQAKGDPPIVWKYSPPPTTPQAQPEMSGAFF